MEDTLEDLIVLNLKFQTEIGSIVEIKPLCLEIFTKYSNFLLKEKNLLLKMDFRLSLISYDKKTGTYYFDKSKLFTKDDSQILIDFTEKFSESIPFKELDKEKIKGLSRNYVNFVTCALYFMKKHYHLDDEIYSNLETLDPNKFSKEKWLNLRKLNPLVRLITFFRIIPII